MLRRPRFKPHLRAEVVPGEGVFVLSERDQVVLQGRLFELVAPCLDDRPVEAVCESLHGRVTPAQVFYTLNHLEKREFLTEAADPRPAGESALWGEQGVDAAQAARRLSQTTVEVRAFGAASADSLLGLLHAVGVRTSGSPRLVVVETDSYLRGELHSCNEEALRAGRPWLLVKPFGRRAWLGPLFLPGKTACWACLAERIRANSPVLAYLDSKRGHTGEVAAHRAGTSATLLTARTLAATAIATWIGRGELPHLEGKVYTLDTLTGEAQTHTLLRLPCCPVCGEQAPADRPAVPVPIRSSPKRFTEDGGHRVCPPRETVERYGHHVSPITGAVSMLEKDGADGGVLHVYLSGPNTARRYHSLHGLRADLRSSNCGKGTTDDQAKASALCEGLERYSGTFRGDEPRRRARLADLDGAAVRPDSCLLFSQKQYRERDAWNATGHRFDEVPLPFDPEAVIDWTPVWSLTHGAQRYLPAAYCWFNYPQPAELTFCYACSNGNAAGNSLEEAVLQGFFELVERDSVALWWYNRVRRPAVDLDSFAVPYLDQLREFLQAHQRELWALDLTSDLGVPAIAAVSRRTDGGAEQILFGLGAHLDARVALLRAVTELNQMLRPVLDVPADDPAAARLTDEMTLDWLRSATLAREPYLRPLEGQSRRAADFPAIRHDDLRDDVLFCQSLVERQGLEFLVLDQTRPEIGLPVVKVIVPGLRHFWARFAPGRLYDVPVKLGWRSKPTSEEELNPIPMFL